MREHVLLVLREVLLRELTERVGVRLVGLAEEGEDVGLHVEGGACQHLAVRIVDERRAGAPGCRGCRWDRP